VFPRVPENPVKFKLLQLDIAVKVNVYAPAVKLKDIELAKERLPGDTVFAVAVAFVMFTTGVPVIVKLVMVVVDQTVPVPLQEIFPVPNAIVLAFEALDENKPVVNVFPFKLRIPLDKVVIKVCPTVKLSTS
jgi:hypothetical protein